MKYRLIGIDLDGTLLDGGGKATAENIAAIARARAAGAMVVPCTGRGWRESHAALAHLVLGGEHEGTGNREQGTAKRERGTLPVAEIPGAENPGVGNPGVFGSGSSVNDLVTGQTLHAKEIGPALALEIVQHLFDLPDSVLVFRDPARAGYDYLVTGRGALAANTQWWFAMTGVTVRYQNHVSSADLSHSLRVGMVGTAQRIAAAAESVRSKFADRVNVHGFEAVQMPNPEESVHVLEIFAAGVDKWHGLSWIARQHGIEAREVAAIGDEINDVAMIRSAGCGIAMGNAIPAVLACADRVTLDNTRHGVAHAIDQLLSGNW
jgi:hypothetical protein